MPLNVDVNQALMLLGLKTLELEQLRAQSEQVAQEFNKLQEENQVLRAQLEDKLVQGALREVK
jgi:hypothetical protein